MPDTKDAPADATDEPAPLPPLPTPEEEAKHIEDEGEPLGGNFA